MYRVIDVHDLIYSGGFATGLLYISMGYVIGKENIKFRKNGYLIPMWLVLYVFFNVIDMNTQFGIRFSEILLLGLTFSLIVFCNTHPGNKGIISEIGRKYSLDIYLFHGIGYGLLVEVLNIIYSGTQYWKAFWVNPA